ncbi:methyltransferase family protein [Nitrosococcus watsonii]|uniref:Isoprenylcysteine carboxyl methyltransferase n=1 Tax=Nitrosococcus watsoni (strain C-113) TaxID=105559 RepID=D8K785_NITWC|nr:isoprenylcysteine carboxylmethyltransferase family protein [Nitrosococcus watsonii]ADJ28762.1 Isoprenylcysteine carboxyl methyltransferase [Nitrosococcus watsonii C-113]
MNTKLMGYSLVILQFLAIILCCLPLGLGDKNLTVSLSLVAIGAAGGVITLYFNQLGNFNIHPEIKPNASLIIHGPYKYIRHPMYTSLLIMMLGITIYNSHPLNFLGLAILILVLIAKSRIEENLLREHFPTYTDYMTTTKKFIPFIF